MSDLEGLARTLLAKNFSRMKIEERLASEILDFKSISEPDAQTLSSAVLDEVESSGKVSSIKGFQVPLAFAESASQRKLFRSF